MHELTGSPSVTMPYMMTTLGCLNWAMITASWRKRTLSFLEEPSFRVFKATDTFPDSVSQIPSDTVPN